MEEGFLYTFQAKNDEKVILRPVEEKDAADIIESVKAIVNSGEYLQKEEPRTLQEEKEFIVEVKKNNDMYTAIEMNEKVIGIARILRGPLAMKRHTGVFRTWIHPDGQGLGIGTEVLYYAIRWARSHQLHKIWLTVFSGNEKAAGLYKKAGFTIEGIQKDQIKINGEFQNEIYMGYLL